MFALANSSKAFRIAVTGALAALLTTCAVSVTPHESAPPTSVQLADGPAPAPALDGFHW